MGGVRCEKLVKRYNFDPMKSKGVGRFVLENQDLDPEHASYLEAWKISESVGWTPEEAGLF